jgi:glucose-6-phosphate 1-dehydrogenase
MPTIFFIFGITGDLARTKLIPALHKLFVAGLLPPKFHIVGFGRREWTQEEFKAYVKGLKLSEGEVDSRFLQHLAYQQGNFDAPKDYQASREAVKKIDDSFGQCSNKLFYLAVPPIHYKTILMNLHASGISKACGGKLGWSRILIEKPFGHDLIMARSLNALLGKLFKEDQIFRIDHYLAKETLQNIVAFKMANPVFDALWNKDHVEKVDIIFHEEKTVGARGAFYDGVGALRDVGQNHMLQMLSLIAMDKPSKMDAKTIHALRGKVVKHLVPLHKKALARDVSRGQYEGYTKEPGVALGSKTETYFKIKAFLSLPRWKGVPFYLESGKGFAVSEVVMKVHFKGDLQNILTFHIQPKESIELLLWGKDPTGTAEYIQHPLSFAFPPHGRRDAYEKILLDCIAGDQMLFASTAEVEDAWKFIMPILKGWDNLPLHIYPLHKK